MYPLQVSQFLNKRNSGLIFASLNQTSDSLAVVFRPPARGASAASAEKCCADAELSQPCSCR